MRGYMAVCICICLALGTAAARAADDGLLFRVSFENGLTPETAKGGGEPLFKWGFPTPRVKKTPGHIGEGKAGRGVVTAPRASLIYDGLGNAHMCAGTAGFFWRPNADPKGSSFEVFDMSPLERLNYSRWCRLSYSGDTLSLYFTRGYQGAVGVRAGGLRGQFKAGEWRHIAIAWDQTRGVAVYVDGKRAAGWKGEWAYEGHVHALGLGVSTRPDFRPDGSRHDQSFDEVRVYDRWLDDASIAALARGEEPQPQPADRTPFLALRRRLFAWDPPAEEAMPSVRIAPDAVGAGLRQAGVSSAKDVLRSNWRTFDGERGRRWPGGAGYTDAGRRLDVTLHPDQAVDVIQLYGSGPLQVVSTEAGDAVLLEVTSKPITHTRAVLAHPFKGQDLAVARRGGVVVQLNLHQRTARDSQAAQGAGGWQRLSLRAAGGADAGHPDMVDVRQTFPPFDQATLMTAPEPAAGRLRFPAMCPVHVLGPAQEERRGLAAIDLDLDVISEQLPNALRIDVVDPLNAVRYATTADVHLVGEAPGRLRLTFDIRDMVLRPGRRPRLALTFDRDTEIAAAGSTVGFRWISVAEALKEHSPDQLARGKDVFQEISESRPWGYNPRSLKTLGLLQNVVDELRHLQPDDPTIAGYWHWIHPGEQKPRVELPPVPDGVPPWAVYMDRSIDLLQAVPRWWIDHRQTPYGEFGANDGINDDTVIIQDWLPAALMRGPDAKLLDSVRRVADVSWVRGMGESGLGHPTDMLHMYEWGINAQSLAAVMDYGNPVRLERLMATARFYERLMGVTQAGHRHFRSHRFGYNRKDPENPYVRTTPGTDEGVNALAMHPGMLLAWYNGSPICKKLLTEWADAWLARYKPHIDKHGHMPFTITEVTFKTDKERTGRGFGYGFMDVPWAAYELTGDRRYLDFVGQAVEYDTLRYHMRMPWGTATVAARYLDETRDFKLAERFQAIAADPRLWIRSLHNGGYNELDNFYYAWQCTGDLKHINEGTKLLCNDMTWELPMLTEAEQSTDRVWLPLRFANRITLGDISMRRNELFPKHAASWEHATGRVVPFFRTQNRRGLQVWLCNLEAREVRVDMRLWRLDHGRYLVRQGTDRNQDGEFDLAPREQEMELARYDVLPLTLPARALWLVSCALVTPMDDVRARPDLAVCADDSRYDPEAGALTLVVHNVGSRPTGAYAVRVRVGDRTLLERAMASLEAPNDLKPRTVSVKVENLRDLASRKLTVELDPGARIAEITEVNNVLNIVPAELPAPARPAEPK